MIARPAMLALLGRLEEVKFSGTLKLKLHAGVPTSLEVHQTAPYSLEGLTVIQTEAPAPEDPGRSRECTLSEVRLHAER
jgi:hypothetical protein